MLITVLDTNDNPPEFFHSSYHFSIREDLAKPGYIVTDQLNVQDKDINVSTRDEKKKCFPESKKRQEALEEISNNNSQQKRHESRI